MGDHISKNWKKQTVTNTRVLLEKSAFILFFLFGMQWDCEELEKVIFFLFYLPSYLVFLLPTPFPVS